MIMLYYDCILLRGFTILLSLGLEVPPPSLFPGFANCGTCCGCEGVVFLLFVMIAVGVILDGGAVTLFNSMSLS